MLLSSSRPSPRAGAGAVSCVGSPPGKLSLAFLTPGVCWEKSCCDCKRSKQSIRVLSSAWPQASPPPPAGATLDAPFRPTKKRHQTEEAHTEKGAEVARTDNLGRRSNWTREDAPQTQEPQGPPRRSRGQRGAGGSTGPSAGQQHVLQEVGEGVPVLPEQEAWI